ncbi:MAG: NlpC/P60 family protein [Candidatus Bruticola sp.]
MRIAKFFAAFSLLCCLGSGISAEADVVYSIREHDTISRVAAKYNVTPEQINRVNPKLKQSGFKPGVVIVIPNSPDDEILTKDQEKEILAKLEQDMPSPSLVNLEVYEVNRAGNRHRGQLAYRGGMGVSGRLVDNAHKYLGTPYVFGGTGNGSFDCSGFTMKMYEMYGVSLPRTADVQYGVGVKVPFGAEMPGDLVFFETYLPGPSHVGIYIGDGKFIHASSSKGVTISRLSQPYYAARYLGAKRVFKEAL